MECSSSKPKLYGHIALCCGMIAGTYSLTTRGNLALLVFGWVGVTFFGLCLLVMIKRCFQTGPLLVLSSEGIDDRALGVGFVPWSEVKSLWVAGGFLCVDVADAKTLLARASLMRRLQRVLNPLLGYPPWCITFVDLTPGLTEVMDYLDEVWEKQPSSIDDQ